MHDRIEGWLGRALARVVDAVQRRPGRVVASYALAAVAAGLYSASHLEIRGDTEALFARDVPFKVAERRYYQVFPGQFENLFVVVDGATPERAGAAAEALAQRLQRNREDFHHVFLPGGGEFFERNAFLYLDTGELEDLAVRLAEAQPYLAELSRDGSIQGLASLLARGARAVREGDVEGEQVGAIYERAAEALAARREGRPYYLSWAEVLASRDFGGDPRRRVLMVQPVLDVSDLQPARTAILAVRQAAQDLGLDADSGVDVRITGDVALSYEEMEVVKTQAAASGVGSLVLVAILLVLGLRSVRMVLATLATLVVGLVLTVGYTAIAVGHFNMISAAFAVLFIGLGVDFGIHICMRLRELLAEGVPHGRALADTVRGVGTSILLCAVTTAVGFFAFAPTDFVGVAELGVISGGGMLISFVSMLTLLPALLSLRPQTPQPEPNGPARWSGRVIELPVLYPRTVRATALALGIASVLLLPRARFDHNPLNVRDPGSESVRALSDLLEQGGSSPWSLNAVAPDLASAEAMARKLRALPEVERVVTVSDFVPGDQEEKLDIIEDVALFLGPLERAASGPPEASVEKRIATLRHLSEELGNLLREVPDHAVAPSAALFARELEAYLQTLSAGDGADASLDALQENLLGELPEQLRVLEAALSAGRVTLENLPQTLVDQMIGEEGQVRVQIFPSGNLAEQASLASFVDAVREVVPDASGSANEIVESGRAVMRSLREALLLSLITITLLLLVLWGGRITETALVLVPLALASALTVASAVLLDIPFNFADVIVLPLLLGIGVDSGIHLVHRARTSGRVGLSLLGTSTTRAVVFSALTTIASFGTLGLATHRGLATLGQLLTLGVAFTLLTTLIVLPALIPSGWRREARSLAEIAPEES